MLVIGKLTGLYYEATVGNNAITYSVVPLKFDFILVSETKSNDYTNRIGKSTKTLVIRTDSKIAFKEQDKIKYNDRWYVIVDIPETINKMSAMKINKVITMVG